MKLNKKEIKLEEGLKKEWLITNGKGSFASSTVIGANTRRYHGLLVASLQSPGRRHLILSKLDESIEIDGEKYDLYTNLCKNYISDGHKYIETFEKEYMPIFTYRIKDTIIEKTICMQYGKNTVCVMYKIKNGKSHAKLTLAPVMNFRDFHTLSSGKEHTTNQLINNNKVKIVVNENIVFSIYMNLNEGTYIKHENDIFKNMYYLEEEKRGFFPEENLVVPGRYEIELQPNKEKVISFVCSLEENIDEINVQKVIKKEIDRLNKIVKDTGLVETQQELSETEKMIKNYILATDNFIVKRESLNLHTIIAGYPWFLDWGRDALISFEGLLLITKRYDIAKEVLLTFVQDIKYGLVPNGYSGFDNRPLYNSVDSALLLFEQINKFIKYTGDYKFVEKNIYKKLVSIIQGYIKGIDYDDNNIFFDDDFLLSSGTPYTQNTWMDAKYEGFAITPRNGKAVEINALWFNALKTIEELSIKFNQKDDSKKYKELAAKTKESFNNKFYNNKKKCLYDVLGDERIRPNQLFALSLTYPIVDTTSDMADEIINTVKKKLLNNYGLKTLSKGEKGYIDVYEGDAFKRDSSYHQGITWTWLLGLYFDALQNRLNATKDKNKKKLLQEDVDKFILNTKKIFEKELCTRGMIGNISEIYDSKAPYEPKGAPAQAWSVAEVFRIIIKNRSLK